MNEKYPAVGCTKRYFVDTASTQVPRGRVALFAGFKHADGTPDRTMSAALIASANSIEELKRTIPEAFEEAATTLEP